MPIEPGETHISDSDRALAEEHELDLNTEADRGFLETLKKGAPVRPEPEGSGPISSRIKRANQGTEPQGRVLPIKDTTDTS